MIPGGIAIVSNIITAYLIQITKVKSPILFTVSLFPLAGAIGLYTIKHTGTAQNNRSLLAVYFILQVFQCITPIIFTWSFANTAGHTKKVRGLRHSSINTTLEGLKLIRFLFQTTTTGMLYIGLTVGNIVGPQVGTARLFPHLQLESKANDPPRSLVPFLSYTKPIKHLVTNQASKRTSLSYVSSPA